MPWGCPPCTAQAVGPIAAILLPLAYFFSVLSPSATEASGVIVPAYSGAAILSLGFVVLGIGLLRRAA